MIDRDMVQIYGLIDPRDELIHYVGSAIDAHERFGSHVSEIAFTKKAMWIAELKSRGLLPRLVILSIVSTEQRYIVEYQWINFGKSNGWPLTNTSAMITSKYNSLPSAKVVVEQNHDGDYSAIYYGRDYLLEKLKDNEYLPIIVDGDIVQLVKIQDDEYYSQKAVLSIVRTTEKGRRYLTMRGWAVPLADLSQRALASLGTCQDLFGG